MGKIDKSAPQVFGPDSNGLAAQKGYDQSYSRIMRVSYTHDAAIDALIAEPGLTNKELAARFGYTEAWISRVIGSDAFQHRLAERKAELVDPFIVATVEDKLKGLASQALDTIAAKLEATQNPDLAVKALDLTVKALGFGARAAQPAGGTVNFIALMPGKAASQEEWAAKYQGSTIEARSISSTVDRSPLVQPERTKLAGEE